jgi:hypothetical protein
MATVRGEHEASVSEDEEVAEVAPGASNVQREVLGHAVLSTSGMTWSGPMCDHTHRGRRPCMVSE